MSSPHVTSGHLPFTSLLYLCHSGLLRTADGVSRSRLGVQSGVSRRGDDQIVTVPLVPLETAPESMPVPTSSSSPAATAAGGSGPDRVAVTGQVGQTSLRVWGSRPWGLLVGLVVRRGALWEDCILHTLVWESRKGLFSGRCLQICWRTHNIEVSVTNSFFFLSWKPSPLIHIWSPASNMVIFINWTSATNDVQ